MIKMPNDAPKPPTAKSAQNPQGALTHSSAPRPPGSFHVPLGVFCSCLPVAGQVCAPPEMNGLNVYIQQRNITFVLQCIKAMKTALTFVFFFYNPSIVQFVQI